MIRAYFRHRRDNADRRVLEAIRQGAGCGFGICEATGLGPGRVYPALERLESAGRIRGRWEEDPGDRPRRRLYSVVEPPR